MEESSGAKKASAGRKRKTCVGIKDRNLLQFEALKNEELARVQIEDRDSISDKELVKAAEGRMLRPSFSDYASGFKAAYCNFFCPDICDNPYDMDSVGGNNKYDIARIRKNMQESGLLHIYSKIEPEIRIEVERHKYFLSQKNGGDVGWEVAEEDYIEEKHLKNFIEGASTCFVELSLQKKNLEDKVSA